MSLRSRLLTAWAAVCVVSACGDDTTQPEDLDVTAELVVSGTIQNNTADPIPLNARLLAVWVVSFGSEDYTYVFGEGSIDRSAGTFELELSDPPPAGALNAGALGVGLLVVTTSSSVGEGDDIADVPESAILGAAGWYGIMYVSDPMAAGMPSWVAGFDAGYSVGEGQEEPTDFDSFVPTDPTGVVIEIDAIENIEFVNWT